MDCTKLETNSGARFSYLKNEIPKGKFLLNSF